MTTPTLPDPVQSPRLKDGGLAPSAEIDALYASDAVGLTLISRDMIYVRINRALADTNGLPPEAHVGRRVGDIVPAVAEQASRTMAAVVRTRRPVGPFDMVGETPARPGDVRIWTQSWTPVFDASGEVAAASVISIDVTEARRAQAVLEARADDVRRVLDGVIAFVGRLDPDGTLTEANQPAIDAGGIRREDVIGRKFWDCYWWSFSEASQARLRAAVARAAGGEAQRYDAEIRVTGDGRMWIDFQLIPQRGADGRVIEIVPSAVDITERRRAEEALRANLDRLRTILTTAQVGIAIAHADGRVTEANRSFLDMVGRSVEELRAGQIDWRDHIAVDRALGWRRLLRDRTLGPLELTLRRRDGREMPTFASAGLLDRSQRELVGFFLDRTRQEADAEHRELLLLELKHRVKNMLATAQAIARQTARHHEDREELVEAFSGRLHAMARAHDLITERNSGQVCLRDLILAQVGPYASREEQLDWNHGGRSHPRPRRQTTRGFFTRWFMSTNHKDIGILYLFTAGIRRPHLGGLHRLHADGADGARRAVHVHGRRALFADAGEDCTPNGHLWNVLITAHGVLMMFFVVIPALFGGFGNYFMPLQIGAPDMAFPRMNNLSFWLYVAGTSLAVASVLAPGGNGQLGSAWAGCSIRRCRRPRGRLCDGPRDLRGAPVGRLVDPGRDQHDHDLPEHARPGHDAAQGAAVRLVDLRHRLADPAGAAGAGRRDHHAADRPQLRHHLLRPLGRRRPGALPAHPVVLRPPGSLHHHPARLRHHQPRHRDLLAASRSSATCRWSMRWSPSACWASSSGRTTCTPWACR
jgi:two-component system, sensor histidine kinase PdtaS